MTDAERLEEIRGKCSQVLSDEYASVFSRQMWTIVDELLTRVDALTAEVARLRHTLAVAYDREAESDDANEKKIIELGEENARLKRRTEFTYCAFCGEEFTLDPAAVVDHIQTCKQHPLSDVMAENAELKIEVTRLAKGHNEYNRVNQLLEAENEE